MTMNAALFDFLVGRFQKERKCVIITKLERNCAKKELPAERIPVFADITEKRGGGYGGECAVSRH